jgi:hypothetical protein
LKAQSKPVIPTIEVLQGIFKSYETYVFPGGKIVQPTGPIRFKGGSRGTQPACSSALAWRML